MNSTLKEIATSCGVDKSTVYRALSGKGRVNAQTVARVQEAAERLGYHSSRNRGARWMASRRLNRPFLNRAVAMLLPLNFHNFPYYLRIHAGILTELSEARQDIYTGQIDANGDELPNIVTSGEADAAILVSSQHSEKLLSRMKDVKIPLVLLTTVREGYASVVCDDEHAGYLSLNHLLHLGHRKVMHFFDKENASYSTAARVAGYERACRSAGLESSSVLVSFSKPPDIPHPQWLMRHLREGLRQCPEITSFLAANDVDAQIIHSALLQAGCRIPEDFSLIGCDDVLAISDETGGNILSTIDLSLEDMGRQAARLALDLVSGRSHPGVRLTLPVKLVVRQSIGSPRKDLKQRYFRNPPRDAA